MNRIGRMAIRYLYDIIALSGTSTISFISPDELLNTLSVILDDFYDSKSIKNLTKNDGIRRI